MNRQLIEQLYRLSADLAGRLDTASFEDIEVYMQQRGALMHELRYAPPAPNSSFERETVRQQLELDRIISVRMKEIKDGLGMELRKIQASKVSKNLYENDSYEDNSYFFDTKR